MQIQISTVTYRLPTECCFHNCVCFSLFLRCFWQNTPARWSSTWCFISVCRLFTSPNTTSPRASTGLYSELHFTNILILKPGAYKPFLLRTDYLKKFESRSADFLNKNADIISRDPRFSPLYLSEQVLNCFICLLDWTLLRKDYRVPSLVILPKAKLGIQFVMSLSTVVVNDAYESRHSWL